MAFWTKFNKNRTWSSVKNIRIWGFGLATCRYIRNAPIFCDHCFLKIWTRYNGMPRNLGFVHNGMPVNAGGGYGNISITENFLFFWKSSSNFL